MSLSVSNQSHVVSISAIAPLLSYQSSVVGFDTIRVRVRLTPSQWPSVSGVFAIPRIVLFSVLCWRGSAFCAVGAFRWSVFDPNEVSSFCVDSGTSSTEKPLSVRRIRSSKCTSCSIQSAVQCAHNSRSVQVCIPSCYKSSSFCFSASKFSNVT